MPRSLPPAIRARRSPRKLAPRAALLLAASLAGVLGLATSPALAVVVPMGGHSYGVAPRSTALAEGNPSGFANPSGHPVVRSSNVYAVYWDPTDHYHGDWRHVIDGFFKNVGAESGSRANVFAVDTQYMDKTGHRGGYSIAFRGAYTDTKAYPTAGCVDPNPLKSPDAITCITDAQIQEELESFIATTQHGLQKGMGSIFYLLTPPGVTVCIDAGAGASHCSDNPSSPNSFCSYHSAITPTNPTTGDGNTVLYATIPWTAGGLGDYHLASSNQNPAYDCQDGGLDPSSNPIIEQPETSPHGQEPNQLPAGTVGPDGSFDTGLADLIVNQIAVEQQDTTTNPLLNAWQDPAGNEVMDECRNFFAPVLGGSVGAQVGSAAGTLYNQTIGGGNYYLNDTFNLAALKLPYPAVPCLPGISLVPEFTAPNSVNAGEIVGFDGMESNITLDAGVGFSAGGVAQPAYATYTWNFGDGSALLTGFAPGAPPVNSPGVSPCAAPWEAPCAASTYHAYQYGGTYQVTLTVTDIGGNSASVTHPITIVGPPPPPAGSTGGGSGGSGSQSTPVPAPVLADFVASKSLKKVLRSGLAVRYTVNEQIAGSLQVLLDSATAKRLGIHGSVAKGLAKGSPPAIVIGSAVLVTTKAGKGTIRIKFSKAIAKHLAHAHKVKLMLRLVARNASRQSPQTTTVLSTVVLSG